MLLKEGTSFEGVVKAIREIKKLNPDKTKDARGEITCPVCKGVLKYSISGYNGHIWGACKTKDCI
jgi:ssDNA-binding Zn-finger/Zn-ribbon topoisomerase 1